MPNIEDSIVLKRRRTKFIWNNLWRVRYWILGLIVCPTLSALNSVYQPYLLKLMLDKIAQAGPNASGAMQDLSILALAYLGIIFAENLGFRLYEYFWAKLNPYLKNRIVRHLTIRTMQHSVSLFHDHMSGSLASKIRDVSRRLPDLIDIFLMGFVERFLVLCIAIYTLHFVSYKFGLLLLGMVLILGVIIMSFRVTIMQLVMKYSKDQAELNGRIVDIFSNMSSVLLFNARSIEMKWMQPLLRKAEKSNRDMNMYLNKLFLVQGLFFTGYLGGCIYLLLIEFGMGYIGAGDFAMVIGINMNVVGVMWGLSDRIAKFTSALGEVNQGLSVALLDHQIVDMKDSEDLRVYAGKIEFQEVCFQYSNIPGLFFANISISLSPNTKIGLVGHSGSGKSSFISLILRLYDLHSGKILIDDQDISCVTQDSLRSNISLIPQDPSLFHRSIMENIRYGRPNASDTEVVDAAQKANAHEFIVNLHKGYDSMVGERGLKLSGGQRQRIAIARAILKDAPILVLDEATSSLDSVTEAAIQKGLDYAMRGKTVIVIAHRLSTLENMDRILVFKQGKIVGDGTHDSLLAKNETYKALWSAQNKRQ